MHQPAAEIHIEEEPLGWATFFWKSGQMIPSPAVNQAVNYAKGSLQPCEPSVHDNNLKAELLFRRRPNTRFS